VGGGRRGVNPEPRPGFTASILPGRRFRMQIKAQGVSRLSRTCVRRREANDAATQSCAGSGGSGKAKPARATPQREGEHLPAGQRPSPVTPTPSRAKEAPLNGRKTRLPLWQRGRAKRGGKGCTENRGAEGCSEKCNALQRQAQGLEARARCRGGKSAKQRVCGPHHARGNCPLAWRDALSVATALLQPQRDGEDLPAGQGPTPANRLPTQVRASPWSAPDNPAFHQPDHPQWPPPPPCTCARRPLACRATLVPLAWRAAPPRSSPLHPGAASAAGVGGQFRRPGPLDPAQFLRHPRPACRHRPAIFRTL